MVNYLDKMIDFYNAEVDRYKTYIQQTDQKNSIDVKKFVTKDKNRISWGGGNWQSSFKKLEKQKLEKDNINISMYRPFTKTWHYAGKNFNHSFYSISPTLLYDFFEANGFNIRSCYLREDSPFNYGRKGRVFSFEGPMWDTPITSSGSTEVCFFATKIRESSSSLVIKPTQSRYKHLNPLNSVTSSKSVLCDWAGDVNDEVSKGFTSAKYNLSRLAISPIILFKSIFKIDFPLPLHCYINTRLGKRFRRSNLKFIGRY
jgi:hypothetical protein